MRIVRNLTFVVFAAVVLSHPGFAAALSCDEINPNEGMVCVQGDSFGEGADEACDTPLNREFCRNNCHNEGCEYDHVWCSDFGGQSCPGCQCEEY